MQYILRMTEAQHKSLKANLFSDRNERVVFGLCKYAVNENQITLLLNEVIPLEERYYKSNSEQHVNWSTEQLATLLLEANQKGMGFIKFHCHTGHYPYFSATDDRSDLALFPSVYGWLDSQHPNASVIMLPNGNFLGRIITPDNSFIPLEKISVAGKRISISFPETSSSKIFSFDTFYQKNKQVFGEATLSMLAGMTVAVVGCSGTGCGVIEQLSRLCVGKLILVDPDVIEHKNLNRIINSTKDDADNAELKVNVFSRTIDRLGNNTVVETYPCDISAPAVIRAVAGADVIFGCIDNIKARYVLNMIASYYLIPYFDIGVRLDSDGAGNVSQVCGTLHYIKPDGSSLLSRKAYTVEQLSAEFLKESNPVEYSERLASKYIIGVQEERPAVISVNLFFSSLTVNEFLARIHQYRHDDDDNFAVTRFSFTLNQLFHESEGDPCKTFTKFTGLGDIQPLLNIPR